MLCVKIGSHQFCILYLGSLSEKTPCCNMAAVCIPGESVGVKENFQMLHASVRERGKLIYQLRNEEINRLCVWYNVLFFHFDAPEKEANLPDFPE